ncbi:NUDIX domain-containing protein [Burkholderia vietnamiensis]|uniref:NUDIX domain-containing protein n=1 Tax=Burkholderia vietnamiensis TaxID=60552 RepID=UPI003D15F738
MMMNTVGDNSAALWVHEIGTPIRIPTQTPSRSDAGTFPPTSWSLSAMLPLDTFLRIVDATPLVAIDLMISNEDGAYLLGHRTNRPAQGFRFVPGGRIHKNERLDDAFRRIPRDELGCSDLERADAELIGGYDRLIETASIKLGHLYRLCWDGVLDLVSLANGPHREQSTTRSAPKGVQAYFAPAP